MFGGFLTSYFEISYVVLKYGTLDKKQEESRPGTKDTALSLPDDNEVADNIKWSQSNHDEELLI